MGAVEPRPPHCVKFNKDAMPCARAGGTVGCTRLGGHPSWWQSIFQRPHCSQLGHGLVGGLGLDQALVACPVLLHQKQASRGLGLGLKLGIWWIREASI